ncbi:MAG: DM13 domain-containing protein [Chloroflexi bacterium]|nr:DM13 domain-containing protein [Chloroflexota bacterium]
MASLGSLGSTIFGALYDYRLVLVGGAIAVAAVLVAVARRRGWIGAARRHPKAAATILVSFLAVALPVGWYLMSPLVLSASIDEPPPPIAITDRSGPAASIGSTIPATSPSARPGGPSASPGSGESLRPGNPSAGPKPLPLERTGTFTGSDEFHFGRGTARLIAVAQGSYVIRLEDFAVRNGPDLYVYLSPSATGYVDGAIELGRLKADTGNQNYTVPAGALGDPSEAASVVIWCRQFSHLFATAPLAP